MKFLITSDLHYKLKQFDWLYHQADYYDTVIIAGDLLDISSYLDLNLQIEVIKKYLLNISQKTRLLVCSGNHDGNTKNAADEFIAPWLQEVQNTNLLVDGQSVKIAKTSFSIFPWWDGDVTKKLVASQLRADSQQSNDYWIWIYHAPPDQSPTSWTGKRYFGDEALNKWIKQYQPFLVISGHIHESPFKKDGSWIDKIDKTWVFNAGNQMGEIPAHIVFDSKQMTATWYSLAGTEQRNLS